MAEFYGRSRTPAGGYTATGGAAPPSSSAAAGVSPHRYWPQRALQARDSFEPADYNVITFNGLNDFTVQVEVLAKLPIIGQVCERYRNKFELDSVRNKAVGRPLPKGIACMAQWEQDMNWYRATVTDDTNDCINVTFVDYGNSSSCSGGTVSLYVPPELRNEPAYALSAAFSQGTMEPASDNVRRMLHTNDGFVSLCTNHMMVVAEVGRRVGVDFYDPAKGTYLSTELMKQNIVVTRASSSPSGGTVGSDAVAAQAVPQPHQVPPPPAQPQPRPPVANRQQQQQHVEPAEAQRTMPVAPAAPQPHHAQQRAQPQPQPEPVQQQQHVVNVPVDGLPPLDTSAIADGDCYEVVIVDYDATSAEWTVVPSEHRCDYKQLECVVPVSGYVPLTAGSLCVVPDGCGRHRRAVVLARTSASQVEVWLCDDGRECAVSTRDVCELAGQWGDMPPLAIRVADPRRLAVPPQQALRIAPSLAGRTAYLQAALVCGKHVSGTLSFRMDTGAGGGRPTVATLHDVLTGKVQLPDEVDTAPTRSAIVKLPTERTAGATATKQTTGAPLAVAAGAVAAAPAAASTAFAGGGFGDAAAGATGFGGGGGGSGCRRCGKAGHFARECPDKPAGGNACFNCGGEGHRAFECPQPRKQRNCYKCQQPGHIARDCTQGAEPPAPANGKEEAGGW